LETEGLASRAGHIGAESPAALKQSSHSANSSPSKTNVTNIDADISSKEKFNKRYSAFWSGLYEDDIPMPTIDRTSDGHVSVSDNEISVDKEPSPIFKSPISRLPDLVDSPGVNRREGDNTVRSAFKPPYSPKELIRLRRRALKDDRRQIGQFKIQKDHPKWVSWTPGSLLYILSWERRFAPIYMRQRNYDPRVRFTNSSKINYSEEYKTSLIEQDPSTLEATWKRIPPVERRRLWPELMCTALDKYPDSVLRVLSATYVAPHPPNHAVSDCLNFVIVHFLQNKTPDQREVHSIYDCVMHLLHTGPRRHLHLEQLSIYLLVTNLQSTTQIMALYEALKNVENFLHRHTLGHLAHRLSKLGDCDKAFQVVQKLGHDGYWFASPNIANLCSRLLQQNGRISSAGLSDTQIFEFMVGCGMKPYPAHYNILLRNSFESGHHETGWQIYDMMETNGIQPDEYTYSILLNDSKVRMDHSALRRVIEMIRGSGMKNAHIGTDILHAIFLLNRKDIPDISTEEGKRLPTAFEKMLSVYCDYFDPQPLAEIIHDFPARFGHLVPGDITGSKSLIAPPAHTLVVMLTGLLMKSSSQITVNQYNWFHHLVSIGNPVVTTLMQSTHVYNLFLMAFGQSLKTLDWCPRTLGDMLSSAKSAATERDVYNDISAKKDIAHPKGHKWGERREAAFDNRCSQTSHRPLGGPVPNVYTWSILLNVFISHGQARAAEKVLTMMESRGVAPNLVTWNSLVVGYARMQDIEMTVDAIDRLEQTGFKVDDFTVRSVTLIRDHRRLIEAMKAKADAKLKLSLEEQDRMQNMAQDLDKALVDDNRLHSMGKP
jgi:pentatricopeptide repeat protein